MKENYIYQIIRQYFTYSYPANVEKSIRQWIADEKWSSEKDKALYSIWNEIRIKPNAGTYQSLDKVKAIIGFEDSPKKRSVSMRVWLKYAAIVVPVFLLLGWYLYSKGIETIDVETANNEQRECTLPDGTTVLLNSSTKISYPSSFGESTRAVTLEGEAYFSVVHNPSKPFIVTAGNLSVKVLGTQFNVSAYPQDDRTIATLNNGSIEVDVKTGETDKTFTLKPNQQIIYNKPDKSILMNTVTDADAAWKSGWLIFQDATFNDIMQTLQRRFDVSISYDKQKFGNDPYTVKFVNRESIEEILNVLQDVTGGFHYEVQANQITLIK